MAWQWIIPEFGGLDVLTYTRVELPPPGPGEVAVSVRAAGVNPADVKRVAGHRGGPRLGQPPIGLGFEASGVIAALGPDTEIASGGGRVGDPVVAFRIFGGYATDVIVPAADVFAKPATLSFTEAGGLLLAGTTAAEAVQRVRIGDGDLVLIHGVSGAVGISAAQQARARGARVIGTASPGRFAFVEDFGVEPVAHGDGLLRRLRDLAPDGVDAVIDGAGTDEALDATAGLLRDPERKLTLVASDRSRAEDYIHIAGAAPESAALRDAARAGIIDAAGRGELRSPVGRTFPISEAVDALELVAGKHPGGKVVLVA